MGPRLLEGLRTTLQAMPDRRGQTRLPYEHPVHVSPVLDDQTVGEAILLWMREETPPTWTGEAQELMNLLPSVLDSDYGKGRPRGRNWPQTARGMSGAIRRIAPALRISPKVDELIAAVGPP